jgi:hypothetical protein
MIFIRMICRRRAAGASHGDNDKKMMSRLVFLILSLSLFFCTLFPASATTVTIGEFFSETEVTAPIMITNVQDLAAATVKVSYDPTVVIVAAIKEEPGSFPPNLDHAHDGWVKMTFLVGGGRSGDVKVAELTISPQGSYGAYSTLDIAVDTLSDTEYRTIDADVIDGFFYLGMNGDAHADRVIDAADSEYIAHGIASDPGYPLKFGPSEVSGDGLVDAYDCVYLARHAAGVAGYEALH